MQQVTDGLQGIHKHSCTLNTVLSSAVAGFKLWRSGCHCCHLTMSRVSRTSAFEFSTYSP